MTGHQPKAQADCSTCTHAASHSSNDECAMCGFDRDNWAPKQPDQTDVVPGVDEKSTVTLGVGDGCGRLFVTGDYESIKRVQSVILDRAALSVEAGRLKDQVDAFSRRNLEQAAEIETSRALLERAEEALNGVIRVADRATVEFDTARSVSREIEEVLK